MLAVPIAKPSANQNISYLIYRNLTEFLFVTDFINMLNLTNVDGLIHFHLSIDSYEFPDTPDDDWYKVRVSVQTDQNRFTKIDPAITAPELLRLKMWFEALSQYRLPRRSTLSFTEPNLEFKFLAATPESIRISIGLKREVKPDFELVQFGRSSKDWSIVFEITPVQFLDILTEIDQSIRKFPVRDIKS